MADSRTDDTRKTVGRLLREARLKAGREVKEIAALLKLDVRHIVMIENDDFANLPAPTAFVKGYIRGYAKQMGIEADELVEMYKSAVGDEPPAIVPNAKLAPQINNYDKPVKAFTYLIAFVLALFAIAWMQSSLFGKRDGEGGPPTGLSEAPPADSGVGIAAPAAPGDAPRATANEPEPPVGNGSIFVELSAGPDTLRLVLTADSWVEAVDADRRTKFMDLAKAGEEYELRGTAPFTMKLGAPEGVRIEYNGAPFDPAPYFQEGAEGMFGFTVAN